MLYRTLQVLTIVVSGLMVGNELAVAAFLHPTLRSFSKESNIPLRTAFAALFGKVMPFWYIATTLLTIVLTWMGPPFSSTGGRLLLASTILWLVTIVFTVIFPAPLNSRIAKWQLESLPADWQAQEHRWDRMHAFRMFLLVAALTCLVAGSLMAI
jgi:hypothetical protein